ncbi:DNA-binding FrmR family transcriptional regulator [Polaromonas sp. CG_9.7]|nr:DNA-binding FrmR family transcriptional regulator [Polaromonas sp. CG_9.7]MBG6115932.1 DNA-binding FrmR family transcriptional regulator [Polaromonas sp. CG_9.2]MDH6183357.1 DNA-binding FrmR family transcriptional regulator [Polaromonas sp. CG_23.6]
MNIEEDYSNLPQGIKLTMKQPHTHASHPAIIKRLRKAGGHLSSTIEMLVQGRSCLDVAQQLQAVEKAIQQAKKALIQDHLDHCLEDLVGPLEAGQRQSMDEFREITRYL